MHESERAMYLNENTQKKLKSVKKLWDGKHVYTQVV